MPISDADNFRPDARLPSRQSSSSAAVTVEPEAKAEQTSAMIATVPVSLAGQRLDQVAVALFPDYSRARLQQWIRAGHLRLDSANAEPKQKLAGGEQLALQIPIEPQGEWLPEAMALTIVYEDEDLLVVDKPAGLVVHPAAGNPAGTLLNGLLHHHPALVELPRAGIVHRLDKDTTGLMVVAKTLTSHARLVAQLQARVVKREYVALSLGHPEAEGEVNSPIGRHPRNRQKMAVVNHGGKEALTYFQVLEYFTGCSYLALQLATGRTHQIRVHMAQLGHPLLGDPLYGANRMPKPLTALLQTQSFQRQALHARRLALIHPASGGEMSWQAPLPADFQQLLSHLRDTLA